MKQYTAQLPNIGYAGAELTDKDMYAIEREIEEIRSNFDTTEKMNHGHAGNLQHEFKLTKSRKALEQLVYPLANTFIQHNPEFQGVTAEDSLELEGAWVNFQKKNEIFRAHTHKGLLSFALWVKVPFTQKQEADYLARNGKDISCTSGFYYYYTNTRGKIIPHFMPVDKSYERKIILFPGDTLHSVSPFYTSNDYRVTVSGNIIVKE